MIKYKKTLVANRGEIAVRIIRALKELGIKTVAVYSEADRGALHTEIADESVCIGASPAMESYLNTYKILSAASLKEVDSIHPGIGFLAENSEFSDLCKEYGFEFIGPQGSVIRTMGNKNFAKKVAIECGVPVIPGSSDLVKSLAECQKLIAEIGLPVVLKATNGGGGKGIRMIHTTDQLEAAYELCKKEAQSSFNSRDLILEKCLKNTRHIEVQIISDRYGNVLHLGDRECTIQRDNQKLMEEAVSVNINKKLRGKILRDAVKIAKAIEYVGPGTVEFLVGSDDQYYFLEMNTRLQVEHTITELVSGVDILKDQIKVFSGEALSIAQHNIIFNGYALQCRILAEEVKGTFIPSIGKLQKFHMPGGLGVRIDSGYRCGDCVSPYYDSLLAKVCCTAPNKAEAIRKMDVALSEIQITGVSTNIGFLKYMINKKRFLAGEYNEKFVDEIIQEYNISAI